jgi:HEAT repeat protein
MSFLKNLFGGGSKPDVDALKAQRDVDGLIEALRYPKDANVRRAAADALGDLGDQRAKVPLHGALEDDDPEVRVAAQTALGKLVNAE